MKFFNIFLTVVLLSLTAYADDPPPIIVKIGGVRVKVVLGNIVDQNTDALALSHWPNAVNDGGGVGGAIAYAGGQSSLEQLQNILRVSGGHLPYTTVYATPVAGGGRLKAHTLLNVIELAPGHQLYFNSQAELESSPIQLSQADIAAYQDLLEKYQTEIKDYALAVQSAQAQFEDNNSNENYEKLLFVYAKGTGSSFETERKALVEKYEKQVGFETVAQSVHNTLKKAIEAGIRSVSFATMGYGIMGDLSITESLAAMLTGVSIYDGAVGGELEVRIVIYAQDNTRNRSWLYANLYPVLKDGNFLKLSAANGVGKTRNLDLNALHENFIKNDMASLVVSKPSMLARITSFCGSLLRKPFEYFRGY